MVTMDCDSATLWGPVDTRVVRLVAERHGKILDASYLVYAEQHHGGVPTQQYFTDASGTIRRIGRFLPLIDNQSELDAPFQPSREFPARDGRIERGVLTLIEEDSPTAHHLCEKLLPFASLYRGSRHPDKMLLGDCEADLLCFCYDGQARPNVVIWLAADPLITIPVADHFDQFLTRLRSEPT